MLLRGRHSQDQDLLFPDLRMAIGTLIVPGVDPLDLRVPYLHALPHLEALVKGLVLVVMHLEVVYIPKF